MPIVAPADPAGLVDLDRYPILALDREPGRALVARCREQLAVEEFVLIAAVWVAPAARDADAVYCNNRAATRSALAAGRAGQPALEDVLAARAHPENPFFRARG